MTTDDKLDLVWGIEEIGKLIGRSFAQTYHMVKSGQLPVVKQLPGSERYYASRKQLIAFFMGDAA
jgi:hypothetical protein